jgi:hypothetical protein
MPCIPPARIELAATDKNDLYDNGSIGFSRSLSGGRGNVEVLYTFHPSSTLKLS